MKRLSFALAGCLALLAGMPVTSAAQTATSTALRADARWAPWMGCWQLTDESLDDGSAAIARMLGVPARRSRENANAIVCVTPASDGAATMTTYVSDRVVLAETIVPDGQQHPIAETGCRGTQRAEWSALAARVYASAEISCDSEPARKVSGLAMVIAGPTWIDIQMVEGGGTRSLRVRRYHRAADQTHAAAVTAPASGTMPLGRQMSLSDVKEASQKVAREALQAALVELKGGFDLNGKRLIELEDAGVSREVIDLMVALSFPERFVVERPAERYSGAGASSWTPMGYDDLWPYFTTPYYGRRYWASYAPFGYGYWGYVNPFYYSGPGYVIIDPGTGGGNPAPQPSGTGRVVDGHGYTRVRLSEPEPVVPRGGRGGDGYSTAGSGQSTNSGSSSGGASPSGYSGGASSGGGRTAQPRPPGR